MTTHQMMQLFRFTDDDLRHNQSGMLSHSQQQQLATQRRASVIFILALAVLALGGLFIFARQLISKPLPITETGTYWVVSIILAIMAGWLLFQVIRPPD